jgi:F-type H+-transporting ATPase subunit delta
MTNKLIASKIANPYAEAFFQLVIKIMITEGQSLEIFYILLFDIKDLLKVLDENPELVNFLKNPLYSNESKKILLNKCFKKKRSIYTINFLNFLIDKKRINVIEEICQKFLEKAYNFACVKFVEVSSPITLTKKQEELLIKKITLMLGPVFTEPFPQPAYVKLIVKIDQKILGGLIIKFGSKVIDLSLRGELQRIAKQMDILI